MTESSIDNILHQAANHPETAVDTIKQALRQWPREIRIHLAYISALRTAGRLEDAVKSALNAIRTRPDSADAHALLAELLGSQVKPDKAIKAWQDALRLEPHHVAWWCQLGEQYGQAQKFADAHRAFERASALDPNNVESLLGLGRVYEFSGQFANAEQAYRQVVARQPNSASAIHRLAAVIGKQKRYAEARELLLKAVELDPLDASTWMNLGLVNHELKRWPDAQAAYQRVVELTPARADAWHQLGISLFQQGQLDEALAKFDHALLLSPQLLEARASRSLVYLLKGDMTTGFSEYEYRTEASNFPGGKRTFLQPPWQGQELHGQTILLFAEQGLGDTIQFLRYVPRIAASGATCIVEVQDENLIRLAAGVNGVSRVILRGQVWPPCTFQSSLMSLPHVFGTSINTIPHEVSYIRVDEPTRKKWRGLLGLSDGKLHIGIVWSGSPRHIADAERSIDPHMLRTLGQVNDVAWYSLQKKAPQDHLARLSQHLGATDLMMHAIDFQDTAGLIDQLDLVIGVDTAVVHLAGALGKPVWTLLHHKPDWRWMLAREDSPWYPTMRLFRQTEAGNWPHVLERVVASLRQLVASRS